MTSNKLILNDETEVILFTSKYKSVSLKDFTIPIGDANINPAASVRNLGVMFDKHMTVALHVNSVRRSGTLAAYGDFSRLLLPNRSCIV